MTEHDHFAEFEKLGEAIVRKKVATLEWQGTQAALVRTWLEMRVANKPKAWLDTLAGRIAQHTIQSLISACIGYLVAAFQYGKWPFS